MLLIALNGLFVAGEFSLLAVAASHTGEHSGNVAALLRRLSFHLGGAQLGITITSLVLGIIAEDTIGSLLGKIGGPLAEGTALLTATAIAVAAAVQMTFGELIPKNLAVSKSLGTSIVLAPVLRIYGVIAAPVVLLFNGIANQTVRALGLRPAEELRVVRTLEELEQVLRSSRASNFDLESARLLGRSLRLAGKVAADALLPRPAMNTLTADASVADLSSAAAEKGHTRFLVTGDDVDDIVGLVDVRDVLLVGADRRLDEIPLTELMRDARFVSEQLPLDRVLLEMEESKNRLVVVIDEHGGTAGLLTREDIFEEAFGNLEDEYDESERSQRQAQTQAQAQSETQTQLQTQAQTQPETQAAAQSQAQTQAETQTPSQPQSQYQSQAQPETQAPSQSQSQSAVPTESSGEPNAEPNAAATANAATAANAIAATANTAAIGNTPENLRALISGNLSLDEASEQLEELAAQVQSERQRQTAQPPHQPAARQRQSAQSARQRQSAQPSHQPAQPIQLGLSLPDGPYETLAGFLLSLVGNIPKPGDAVIWQGWRFEIVALDKLRIAQVAVEVAPESGTGTGN